MPGRHKFDLAIIEMWEVGSQEYHEGLFGI